MSSDNPDAGRVRRGPDARRLRRGEEVEGGDVRVPAHGRHEAEEAARLVIYLFLI